jgi:ATP-binding cassette subfamily F protein uup
LKSGKKDEPKVSTSFTENKKATFAEQKEYANLEIEIDKHEKEKHDLVNKLTSSGGKGFEELNDISKKIELITNQIDTKTLRWLELAEKM